MSKEDLESLVEPDKAREIRSVMDLISEYAELKSVLALGLTVHHSEIDFDKIMIFSWIKEEIENGRKN
jgi:hypothetical protein